MITWNNLLSKIKSNWKSGLAVSLVSIPMAVSLAVASESTPVAGIIAAIWAGLIASFFGGSNFTIIGPTGALSGVLTTFAITYGAQYIPSLTIVAGLFIFIAYIFKFQRYLIYFPASTIHGFILGLSFILILSQLNFALGLSNLPKHTTFVGNIIETYNHLPHASLSSFLTFLFFLVLLFIFLKLMPNIPGAIPLTPIAITIGYLSTKNIFPISLRILDSQYPHIEPSLFIKTTYSFFPGIFIPAVTVAIVAILETLISAKIADGLTKTSHNSQKELLGLGLANICSGIAGGIPVTAVLARTMLNIKSGCTDKISATISSIFIFIISFFFLSFFKYIPLTAIAAMLVFVAIRMIEREYFIRMFRLDKKNLIFSFIVAIVTVYENPIIGILLGATIAMLTFMEKLSKGQFEFFTETVSKIQEDVTGEKQLLEKIEKKNIDILTYAIKGQLAYINAQAHVIQLKNYPVQSNNVILKLKDLFFIDFDGVEAFDRIVDILHSQGKLVMVSNVSPLIANMLEESGKFTLLKKKGLVFETRKDALISLLHE